MAHDLNDEKSATLCALCLRAAELRESHLIPAGIYRLVKSVNQELVLMTQDKSFHTSREIKAKLLCDECEQRFAVREDYFLSLGPTEAGDFPLCTILAPLPVLFENVGLAAVATDRVPGLDVGALAYFVASVFWRASAREWIYEKRRLLRSHLGPYRETFRSYLLGLAPFPFTARLVVMVATSATPPRVLHIPLGWRENGYHLHRFRIPGFHFLMAVGNNIPADFDAACIVHSPVHVVFRASCSDEMVDYDMRWLKGITQLSSRLSRELSRA